MNPLLLAGGACALCMGTMMIMMWKMMKGMHNAPKDHNHSAESQSSKKL